MKRIIQDNLNKRLPANTNFLKYVDQEMHDNLINLCIAMYGDNAKVILSGIQATSSGLHINYTSGYVFTNNELFFVNATSLDLIGIYGHGFVIETTEESEVFKDGNSYPAYRKNSLILTTGAFHDITGNSISDFKRIRNEEINFTPNAITGVQVLNAKQVFTHNLLTIFYDAIIDTDIVNFSTVFSISISRTISNTPKHLGFAVFRAGLTGHNIPIYTQGNYIRFNLKEYAGSYTDDATFGDIFSAIEMIQGAYNPKVRVSFTLTINI